VTRKSAAIVFASACVVLAGLLLVGLLTPLAAGIAFALALLAFGVASRGFTS
jgi:hypothetical protein